MRKIFLIITLIFTSLSYAQVDSTSKSTKENSYYGRRYPVFPDDQTFPEKGSAVPIFILSLFGIGILALTVFIIRKAKGSRSRIIIDGYERMSDKRLGSHKISGPIYVGTSSIYSKRKGSRDGRDKNKSSGGIGGGW
ncbi:MAG: hypothetical protein J0M18_03680 [Ignavibacteria bacterium]|nr:hypothetical protein [Ignavibacteria bacterium]